MNEWTAASLKAARREAVLSALAARKKWHALRSMGFHYYANEPRKLMRAKLETARLYRA